MIYDHPKDFPDSFVVRSQWPLPGGVIAFSKVARTAPTLEAARKLIPQGLYCIKRSPEDDPVIVESWL